MEAHRTSCASNQPQYESSHLLFGSSANQFHPIFAVFELPNELILNILSNVSPDPQLTGRYAQFRIPYSVGIIDCHNQRVEFLRLLSMTCKAMRLRLMPWVWERLDLLQLYHWMVEGDIFMKKLDAITNALYANVSPAANVK